MLGHTSHFVLFYKYGMRKQKKYHFIYRTTCLITNKFYVGMHSTDNHDDGYLGSGKILGYSIAKHGRENHKLVVIEHLPSREALKFREKEIVNEELLADPLNINLKYGGEGGWDHLSSDQHRAGGRVGGQKTGPKNIRAAHNDEVRKKIVEARKAAGNYQSYMTGKKHSEETKKQMATSQTGSKNSQFGKCWVMKDGISKSIPKEQLDAYLVQGFRRGRKCKLEK